MGKFDEEQDDIQFVKLRVMDYIEEDETKGPIRAFVDMYFCDKQPRA